MSSAFQYDVFLSHNSADKSRVRALAERLRSAGLRVWFDERVIAFRFAKYCFSRQFY
ncbi:toll/interleukin-1 receptor domain-containing protein [Chlorobaculum limnaeum]|uniref:toll/interleukin-1 receptor domain-containing protein n=1 Tax=Chlorobaculum limnaeum TaxID=274537 RepID=UPI0012ED7625|nr:toll/interleukin-1 receptor domain-containing protein [Chlorobaculum limnaeum]